ncbi:MAG: calcium-translocating P-type ATPase, PMCA-type [Clostridia bacterium]|nr:calcium-translocating P-type ATPase, PMCA-type [Clostridia bacterium]
MEGHFLSAGTVLEKLGSEKNGGLTDAEAKRRLEKEGENKLTEKKKTSLIKKFFEQFKDFCVIILFVACIISFATGVIEGSGDFVEPIVILAIVILNAVIGVYQENRAEKAIEALKKMSAPSATVKRSGKIKKIPASQLVKGDIILLESGDMVPADVRLISSNALKVQESALTGESEACEKSADVICTQNCPLAEMKNTLFASTNIIAGNAVAVVTETGMQTQVGKIADMLQSEEAPQTPLQKRLEKIGKALGTGALAICGVVFIIGIIRKSGILPSFMLSVSLAVAAIPEGLPAIVTIVLSMGVQRMAKSNAIIRHLPAVETLGAATVICSDKTGTLTQNKMSVVRVENSVGELDLKSSQASEILFMGALCNNSRAEKRGKSLVFGGDPTETAIMQAAWESGTDVTVLSKKYPRIHENPFSGERKMMSTVNSVDGEKKMFVKGAPDVVLERCGYVDMNGSVLPITAMRKKKIAQQNNLMAESALRVIAVAYRKADGNDSEENLIFSGLIGMTDPPRPEAAKAVEKCKRAGIIPVMITGDHAVTACAVAKKLGIYNDAGAVTGSEIERMSDAELAKATETCRVFARVTPGHKVRIVKAFRSRGEIAAMTGDGVNDAPALKAADIGCAMGRNGTEVAKNAADMIMTDDNFATIVKAVEQGRGIYDNIKKAVHFLLGTNIGEIVAVFAASLLGFSQPLIPIQLLWINLVTDSLPAMALGTENTEKDIMERKPISPKKGFFSDGLWLDIMLEGLLIGILTLLSFSIGSLIYGNIDLGRTMAFATLSFCEIAHAVNMRSSQPLYKSGLFSNKMMNIAVLVCTGVQAAVMVIPSLAEVFSTVPMTPVQWAIVASLSLVTLATGEAGKFLKK